MYVSIEPPPGAGEPAPERPAASRPLRCCCRAEDPVQDNDKLLNTRPEPDSNGLNPGLPQELENLHQNSLQPADPWADPASPMRQRLGKAGSPRHAGSPERCAMLLESPVRPCMTHQASWAVCTVLLGNHGTHPRPIAPCGSAWARPSHAGSPKRCAMLLESPVLILARASQPSLLWGYMFPSPDRCATLLGVAGAHLGWCQPASASTLQNSQGSPESCAMLL